MIETKYLGPTNHRGGRVKATIVNFRLKTKTLSWDHALDPVENHTRAAQFLSDSCDLPQGSEWEARYYSGVDGGGYIFTFTVRR